MKKGLTMLMFMLACCLFASAQSDMSSDSMKKDKTQDSKMDSKMTGEQTSMTGCIAEKDGKYMMMNQEHPDGVQLTGSTDMKPHVGHKVSVTGMMGKMSDEAAKPAAMSKDDKMAKDDTMMKHDDMGMMQMNVSSMKMMSTQCDMSKMSK